MKGRESGETAALQKLGVEFLRVSACKKFFSAMTEEEKKRLREDVCRALPVIAGWLGNADLVVLDEALGAIRCGILTESEVLSLIAGRGGTELVLTGRSAPDALLGAAHLVTEMKEIKHYFASGQQARKGIEY
jgi:cob(I)alamin adenosyltransferase